LFEPKRELVFGVNHHLEVFEGRRLVSEICRFILGLFIKQLLSRNEIGGLAGTSLITLIFRPLGSGIVVEMLDGILLKLKSLVESDEPRANSSQKSCEPSEKSKDFDDGWRRYTRFVMTGAWLELEEVQEAMLLFDVIISILSIKLVKGFILHGCPQV
jgi:hypothetical protein